MKVGNNVWFYWKEENKTILILEAISTIKFKKIFKTPKLSEFKDDKYWLNTKYMKKK
jgi:hypothetical protein